MLSEFKWIDTINETNLSITIRKTGSTITLKGCENYDSLRGVGIDFLILDEFADIDKRTWFEVLRASVSDTMGRVLMCGTPRGFGNWSYEMFLKGTQDPKEWDNLVFGKTHPKRDEMVKILKKMTYPMIPNGLKK